MPVPMKPITTPTSSRGLPATVSATVPTQPTAAVKTSVMVDRTEAMVRPVSLTALRNTGFIVVLLGVLGRAAVVDHSGDIHPVAAGIELGLAAGVVVVEGDVKEAFGGVGGPDAADPAVGDGGVVLDVDGVGGELVRQGQDLIGVVGGVGGVIGPSGGQGAGGDPQLVQVDGAGGLYVELVRRGLGEAAGAYQIAVDEIVQLPAGEGDAHGHPLVAVAIVGKISNNFSGRCKSVLPIQIMSAL